MEPERLASSGLVAMGEADAASDLNLLVETEPGRSLLGLGGFLMKLQDLLECRVDIVKKKGWILLSFRAPK